MSHPSHLLKCCCVVGARPNFMKMAPVVAEFQRRGWRVQLVHTGQHYDTKMSDVFFSELGLPQPDVSLNVGSNTHARQTAQVMIGMEDVLASNRPDLLVVAGDVNSTMASALAAAKLGVPIAHIEAGLRSFDRTMPEEINRVVTDQLSELLFTTEESANRHLLREGIGPDRIHFVGNCMVDSLHQHVEGAVADSPWSRHRLQPGAYALATLHRPSNVDQRESLASLIRTLNDVSGFIPVLFPMHPRTLARLQAEEISLSERLHVCEPLPYREFLGLMARARFVMTDSGGIQEETTALKTPCLTLRENTERPATQLCGSNRLVGVDRSNILRAVEELLTTPQRDSCIPPLWDGRAASRIGDVVDSWFCRIQCQPIPKTSAS